MNKRHFFKEQPSEEKVAFFFAGADRQFFSKPRPHMLDEKASGRWTPCGAQMLFWRIHKSICAKQVINSYWIHMMILVQMHVRAFGV